MTKQAGIRAGILKKTVIAVKPEPMTIALDEPFVPIVVLIGICPVHSVDCPAALLRVFRLHSDSPQAPRRNAVRYGRRRHRERPRPSVPGYGGDHEDISDGDSYELGEYENSEEALAAAEAFISTHGNEVNDEEHGIGSVTYWTIEVERRTEYKENEWLPCDESGRIDDGYGNEPDAIVAYFSSLEGSREERAFELAKNEYLAWLEHRTDRYTTVYGYMN